MNDYPDAMSKMALSLTSAQLAKDLMVDEFGIGEDLAFNFFFWRDNQLIMVVQMKKETMRLPVVARLPRCMDMCAAVRTFWGADAISLVAEGFETIDKERLNGRELEQAFIEDPNLVKECITVTHCEKNHINDDFEVTLVSNSYTYELGRKIVWGEPVGYTRGTETILRKSPIPQMLTMVLQNKVEENPTDEDYDRMLSIMTGYGFNVEEL